MPIGVPMRTAITVSMMLPTIGLSSPPAEPGGGVISVKTAGDRPLRPSNRRVPRIMTSQPRPTTVAASDRPTTMLLTARRRL